jgi:hypothetical protein
MQQERAYLKALETIQSYTLTTDGKLEIRCGQTGPSQVLQFVRVETTAASLNPSNNPTSMTLEGGVSINLITKYFELTVKLEASGFAVSYNVFISFK